MSNKLKGTLYVLLCVALWALIPVVAKIGQAKLDNHQFLFWSSLVSFIVLAASTIFTGNFGIFKQYTAKEWLNYIALGLLGTYIYYLFLYLGYSKTAGMEVLVIQYTWPIQIVLLSVFLLNERINIKKLVSVALGFIGALLVLTKGDIQNISIENPFVIALVATGALCFALFSVLNKKVKREPLGVITIYFLTACVASFISMLGFSEFSTPTRSEYLPILLNGILVNGFSYVFWILALRNAEASYLAIFTFITPVLSAIYLILFFNEPFETAYLIGLALVIMGGLVNTTGFSNSKKRSRK